MTPQEQRVADDVLGEFARQQHDWFERVRKGSLDPEEVARAVQALINRGALFIPPHEQLNLARQRNVMHGWGFTGGQFHNLGKPPAWPEGRLAAVILDVSLSSVQQTFEEAWHFICEAQKDHDVGHYRFNEVESNKKRLRLLEGIVSEPWTIRWRVVDLAANWDKERGIPPQVVRNPKESPHSAILWAASYFPKWVQAMDSRTVPYVWVPGYQLCVAGAEPWLHVPKLHWDSISRIVMLNYGYVGNRFEYMAVPEFRD